jgi:D-sedoheptulose 7-phosphate isomerase
MHDTGEIRTSIRDYQAGLLKLLENLSYRELESLIQLLESAYTEGRRVFVVGNGGSAATASHMACDLAKTVLGPAPQRVERRFRIMALTDNVPLITAYGNDIEYASVFSEPLRNLAERGDILIAISASGNSANIVEVVAAARTLSLKTVGLLGFDGGEVGTMVDTAIIIPSDNYGYVEDLHMILVHIITDYFKRRLAARSETDMSSPSESTV